jgi:hypothetical protein
MGLTTKWNCFDIAAQALSAKGRCMVCTKRAAGRMLAFQERPARSRAPLMRQVWLLCADCAADVVTAFMPEVVTEVERAALREQNERARVCHPVVATNGHGDIQPAGDRAAGWGASGDQHSTVKGANFVESHRLPSLSTTSRTAKRRPAVESPRPSECPASPLADMEHRRAVGHGGGAHGNLRVCAMEQPSVSKTFAHHLGKWPWRVVTVCRSVYAVRRDPRRRAWLAPTVSQSADSSTAEHDGPTSERAADGSGATECAAHHGSRRHTPATGRRNHAPVCGHCPLAQWRHTDTRVQRAYAAIGLCRGRTAVMSASDRRTRCNFRGWPPWAMAANACDPDSDCSFSCPSVRRGHLSRGMAHSVKTPTAERDAS